MHNGIGNLTTISQQLIMISILDGIQRSLSMTKDNMIVMLFGQKEIKIIMMNPIVISWIILHFVNLILIENL